LPLVDEERRLRGYQLEGQFTLHGVTRPLKVKAEAASAEGLVHLRCSFAVLQSQFGITPFSKAFGMVGVADRLTIYGDAWLMP
jgi:polyisoprenoid-binding protein YceI